MRERRNRLGKSGSKRRPSGASDEPSPSDGCHLSDRRRSRLAVLPFAAGGSEKAENLAFALAHEITAALGRSCRFDVIAGMTTDAAVASCVREHQFRRMNLDYLVDLTVAEKGRETEINIRLLDLDGEARPIWSKRLDLMNYGLHQIGDLVATHIVNQIEPNSFPSESGLKARNRLGAGGFLRRALPLMFSMEREKFRQAGQLIKSALEIEPEDAESAALAARWQHFSIRMGYTEHSHGEFAKARDLALRAIKADPYHAEALGMYAHYCAFIEKKFDTALHYFDRSLRINPSSAFVWALSGPTYCYIGEPRTALERLDHYRELAPFDSYISPHEYHYPIAYLFNQDYERAASAGRYAVARLPAFVNGYKPLIAALGHLGRRQEAKPYVDKLLTLEPGFTVERFAEVYPIKKAADRRRYMDGLRLAGVAER